MADDDPKLYNGKKPPDHIHFERGPVTCKRCGRAFDHFVIEEIDRFAQLRCGDVLLTRAELVCLHCGSITYWNIREKDIEKMVHTYAQILVIARRYNPE